MTTRKPLVLVAGNIRELPSGDAIKIPAADIRDSSSVGREVIMAPDRWGARSALGVLSGFENRFINGMMAVSQRGGPGTWASTGNASGATAFSADRWLVKVTGTAWSTGQAMVNWGWTIGAKYALIAQTTSVYSGVLTFEAYQRIAAINSFDLAGQVVTVSATVYHDASGPMAVDFYAATPNTEDTWSGASTAEFSTAATSVPSGSLTFVTQTVTLGSNAARGLAVAVRAVGNGNASTATSFYVTGMQLRLGPSVHASAAFTVERRPYEMELLMCMRYLHILRAPPSGNTAFFAGHMITSVQANYSYNYPVPMRAVPTITSALPANFRVQTNGNNPLAVTLAFQGIGQFNCMPYASISGSGVANAGTVLINENGPAGSWIMFDAELK